MRRWEGTGSQPETAVKRATEKKKQSRDFTAFFCRGWWRKSQLALFCCFFLAAARKVSRWPCANLWCAQGGDAQRERSVCSCCGRATHVQETVCVSQLFFLAAFRSCSCVSLLSFFGVLSRCWRSLNRLRARRLQKVASSFLLFHFAKDFFDFGEKRGNVELLFGLASVFIRDSVFFTLLFCFCNL